MFTVLKVLPKNLFILICLSVALHVHAQQSVNSDAVSQPLSKELQIQVFELLTMDCGVDGGLDKFKTALIKLPVDASPIFLKILQEGVPEQILDSVRQQARANYDSRQQWLKSNGASVLDKQTVERMSKISLEDFVNRSMQKLNVRYEENAIRGLEQMGNLSAIAVIEKSVKQKPELAILAQKAIETINNRFAPK